MNTRTVLSSFAAIALLTSACGRSDNGSASPAPAATASANASVRVIEVTGNDAMQFNVTEITAKPGETLRISFRNVGKMPKQAMSHNWVLLKPMTDGEVNAFGMAASSKAPTYLPDDQSAIIAHTKMLGAGESDQIEFQAPATAGTYPFICTFPGHFAIMKGKLVVK